jgi:integrase
LFAPVTVLNFCRDRELSPGTTYQYHSVAAGFSKWLKIAGIVDVDRFAEGKRPSKPKYRARPAGTDELLDVLEHAREPMRSWAILAAYAGLRCVEIARLSGRDLVPDGNGWILRIPEGKGSKPSSVPAHPFVVELLRFADPGKVWPTANAQKVSQKGNAEMRRLGVRCRMHQLRHSFATELYRQTRDVLTVQHALRHEQLETTARYIMFDDGAVRSAVAALAFVSPTIVARKVPSDEHDDRDDRASDGLGHVKTGKARAVENDDEGSAGERAANDLWAEIHGGIL